MESVQVKIHRGHGGKGGGWGEVGPMGHELLCAVTSFYLCTADQKLNAPIAELQGHSVYGSNIVCGTSSLLQ